jgi:hypothetical protein
MFWSQITPRKCETTSSLLLALTEIVRRKNKFQEMKFIEFTQKL